MSKDQNNDGELLTRSEEGQHSGLMLPSDALPTKLYLIPVNNRPFFPAQVHPIVVPEYAWQETLERVHKTPHQAVGLIYVETPAEESLESNSFPHIGCVVRVFNLASADGSIQFIAQGLKRFRIRAWLHKTPPYLVEVDYPQSHQENTDEVKAYALALIQAIKELLPINPLYNEELKLYLKRFGPNEPSPLADFAAALTSAEGRVLQDVLETIPILRRMKKVLVLLRKEIEVATLQGEIRKEVDRKISETQREFFLREQMKVIQKELGISKDDRTADIELFRERLTSLNPPPAVIERADDELKKLAVLETGSPEYGVTRNYLDWVTTIPWGVFGKDKLDLKRAKKILDRDHDGLEDVKKRILEFLALGAWKGAVSGSIILLIGPPGVGKTSIGRSVADALGRRFFRFSLGGMRDEAEIKGHRRTYIGAMPGKLAQAFKEVKVANPVIMLDEIDKLGISFQGDPASALLEVLDPEQNVEFLDHYLDLRLDLSKVLFICTANQWDTIPAPLLDRMEVIRLPGYLTDEKMAIAKNHLWPKALKYAALKKSQLQLTDAALRRLIEGYVREAGVRQLEQQLQKIVRKSVVRLLKKPGGVVRVSSRNLQDFLGEPPFKKQQLMKGIGVVTGLAWTALGGVTLAVEAAEIDRVNRGFKLTGKLGEVMRESAEIAYSFVSSHARSFGAEPELFEKALIHLHVPEGATPKDGPSAGIAMATALLSMARRESLPRPLAMTGELTLTGIVLPVGGIREKVIAAKRSGISELILPADNRKDFEELPEAVREGIKVHFAQNYADVYRSVFTTH